MLLCVCEWTISSLWLMMADVFVQQKLLISKYISKYHMQDLTRCFQGQQFRAHVWPISLWSASLWGKKLVKLFGCSRITEILMPRRSAGRIENLERLFTHWLCRCTMLYPFTIGLWRFSPTWIYIYIYINNPFWNKTRPGKLEICDVWRRPKRIERTACRCHFREVRDFAAGCSILPLASSEIFAIVKTWDSANPIKGAWYHPPIIKKKGYWENIPMIRNSQQSSDNHIPCNFSVLCLAHWHIGKQRPSCFWDWWDRPVAVDSVPHWGLSLWHSFGPPEKPGGKDM